MASVSLTAVATAAVQHLGGLDSGEILSTQQLNDAFAAANLLLESWYQEQVLTIQSLVVLYTLAAGTYTPAAVPVFANNSTPISLPLGVARALEFNLAVELAGQYALPVPPNVSKQASESRFTATPVMINPPRPEKNDEPGEP